jgi:hypothetical protein
MKGSGETDLTVIDRYDDGVGWLAYPDESMKRAAHAVVSGDGLWVVDPVDADGVDDLLAEYGEVAGVVVLFDRHTRDSAAVAKRHDVPVYVPEWMSGVAGKLDAPVERVEDGVGAFALERVVDNPLWQEAALFDGETLVVPEALGTVSYFRAPGEDVGVHPMLRALPPRSLSEYAADRLLVGHGEGVFEDVRPAIPNAVEGARRRMVPLYLDNVKGFMGLG